MHENFDQPDMEVSMGNFLARPFRDTELLSPFESPAS